MTSCPWGIYNHSNLGHFNHFNHLSILYIFCLSILGTSALDFQVYQRDVATDDQLPELEVRGSIFCKTARKLIHYALNQSNGTYLSISTLQTFINHEIFI